MSIHFGVLKEIHERPNKFVVIEEPKIGWVDEETGKLGYDGHEKNFYDCPFHNLKCLFPMVNKRVAFTSKDQWTEDVCEQLGDIREITKSN